MPTAEVKSVWWACITRPSKSAKLSHLPCCWGANANKATTLEPSELSMLCLFPISVFFTHSLSDVLRKGQGTVSIRRGLRTCVQTTTPTANFWAQIIYDPYRRPLNLTFLHVSTRGLLQDTMFDRLRSQHVIRGCFRSFSATAYLRHWKSE